MSVCVEAFLSWLMMGCHASMNVDGAPKEDVMRHSVDRKEVAGKRGR